MERIERIAARAEAHVAAGAFSGIEWRVLRGGEVWSEGRVGLADGLTGRAMPDVPIYRIYSMTKPIVSAVAMMLLEEGKLRLFDPVAKFIPAFASMNVLDPDGTTRPARGAMLIEQLLSHRSGLTYSFLPDCPVAKVYRESPFIPTSASLAEFAEILATAPLAFDPGTDWRYSVATDILARVIEVIEGAPLGQVLGKRVFAPLGLEDTGYFVPEDQRHRLMTMFGQGDLNKIMDPPTGAQALVHAQGDFNAPADNPDFARGGHGLFSTVPDYTKIALFLASGKTADGQTLLSRKALQAMWANRIPPAMLPLRIGPIAMMGYGYSLAGRVMIDPGQSFGLSSMGEYGWAGAASTYFWIDPQEDVIGVVMSQYLGSMVPLADDMRDAVYQALD